MEVLMKKMSEKVYDNEIAPKLLEIAKMCETEGIPFLAIVEWTPGKIGRTELQTNNECIEMVMIRRCAKTVPNIDSYIIGLSRYAKEKNIDTSDSIIMSQLENK